MGGDAEILYRLDDRDEIIFVNDAWSVFANANDGEHVIPSQLLGRSLWDLTLQRDDRVPLAVIFL